MTTGQQGEPRAVLTTLLDAVWSDLMIAPDADQIMEALTAAGLAIVPAAVPPLAELVTAEDVRVAIEAAFPVFLGATHRHGGRAGPARDARCSGGVRRPAAGQARTDAVTEPWAEEQAQHVGLPHDGEDCPEGCWLAWKVTP